MFVPKCLNNLRKRSVPSEAKPQEEEKLFKLME